MTAPMKDRATEIAVLIEETAVNIVAHTNLDGNVRSLDFMFIRHRPLRYFPEWCLPTYLV